MPRNHTVVFVNDRDSIKSVICASGKPMEAIEPNIWECCCCECYLILKRTSNYGERRVEAGKNCRKHKAATIDVR